MSDNDRSPGVFAVPPETSLRFLLVIGVLFASVVVSAESLYYSARAEYINDVMRDCERAASQVADPLTMSVGHNDLVNGCRAPHERERVVWTAAALGVSAVAAGAALLVRPWLRRRRRRLIPIPKELGLDTVLEGEAVALGIHTQPLTVWDPLRRGGAAEVWWQPRRNVLELSPGLAAELRHETPRSRGLIRHELAHIRNRDVLLGALTDGAAVAYLLAAVLPLAVVMLFWFDGPVTTTLTALARLGVLGLVLVLARASTLRSRELDADGRAAEGPGAIDQGTLEILDGDGVQARAGGPFDHHPSNARRRIVLADPVQMLQVGVFDGFVAGFATFVLLPTVVRLTGAWLTGQTSGLGMPFWVAAAFALPIGIWLGLAGTRLAWAVNFDGQSRPGLRLGVGVGLGAIAGLLLLDEPLYQPIGWLDASAVETCVLIALALAALGLSAWTVAMVGMTNSARQDEKVRRGLIPVLLIACLASVMVIGKLGETWYSARFSSELITDPGQGALFGAFRMLWVTATSGYFASFAAAVVVSPLVVRRLIVRTPTGLQERGTGLALAVGLFAGFAASLVFVVYDWRVSELTTNEELSVTSISMRYLLVAEILIIIMGALAALVVAAFVGRRGVVLGTLAMVTAGAVGSVGVMVQLVRRGSKFDRELIANVAAQIVPLAAIGGIVLAGALALAVSQGHQDRRTIWVVGLVLFGIAVPALGLGGAAYALQTVPARREAIAEYDPWLSEHRAIAIDPLLACAPVDLGGDPVALAAQPELLSRARNDVDSYRPRTALLRDAQDHLIRAFELCEVFLRLSDSEPAEWIDVQTALQAELADWRDIFKGLGIGGS